MLAVMLGKSMTASMHGKRAEKLHSRRLHWAQRRATRTCAGRTSRPSSALQPLPKRRRRWERVCRTGAQRLDPFLKSRYQSRHLCHRPGKGRSCYRAQLHAIFKDGASADFGPGSRCWGLMPLLLVSRGTWAWLLCLLRQEK